MNARHFRVDFLMSIVRELLQTFHKFGLEFMPSCSLSMQRLSFNYFWFHLMNCSGFCTLAELAGWYKNDIACQTCIALIINQILVSGFFWCAAAQHTDWIVQPKMAKLYDSSHSRWAAFKQSHIHKVRFHLVINWYRFYLRFFNFSSSKVVSIEWVNNYLFIVVSTFHIPKLKYMYIVFLLNTQSR